MTIKAASQNDSSCFAIKVLKTGKKFQNRKNMNEFSKKGFYIYTNYCYSLDFNDSTKVFGRIINITSDSILITNSFNSATAFHRKINYDTLKYEIKDIKSVRLITENIDGYTRNIVLADYSVQAEKAECCSEIPKVISSDNNKAYDCYPYLTNSGICFIYERDGLIYVVDSMQAGK